MADLEAQIHAAKAFLLQSSSDSKSNLYDHLSECLSKILDERPKNALDIFEQVSESVKKDRVQPKVDTLQDQNAPSDQVDVCNKQKVLFQKSDKGDEGEEEEVTIPFPNLLDIGKQFEQAGLGLNRTELYRIYLALKQLSQTHEPKLASVRFWGKVFGTEADYIIAETEFPEGEGEEPEEEANAPEGDAPNPDDAAEQGSEEEKDEPPKSQWKPPPVIPKEEPKTGTNKKTYFVCNQPGDPWVKLPHVTPAQIAHARQIRKFCTGKLDAPVVTYPPFPGKEENYLRAQIARITATTHISPTGYFQFEEAEEEDADGKAPGVIEVNPEFEISKITDLLELSNWSHHTSYILPQGRTTWYNPVQKADDEFEDGEEGDEEKEQPEELEPETGPQLLTSVAEDAKINNLPPWSTHLTSAIVPQYALAVISSNLWPGAHAIAHGKKFETLYIGWGLKYSSTPFNPALPPPVQEEFPTGADITETTDPTVEQEAAVKAAQEEAEATQAEEEEPEEEED